MAEKKIIKALDEKLIKEKIINKDYATDYDKVHNQLNKFVHKYDKALKEENFKICEKDLRKWLTTLEKQGASQEKLTSYLRCGLAHLCFDFIDVKNEDISKEQNITRALQSFRKRNYDKSYYKSVKK